MQSPDSRVGYIYFVSSPSLGLIKIGYSRRKPNLRFDTLQTSCPAPLERMGLMEGSWRKEQELHRMFEEFRVYGEWFRAADAILAYIAENAPSWPTIDDPIRPKRRRKPRQLPEPQPPDCPKRHREPKSRRRTKRQGPMNAADKPVAEDQSAAIEILKAAGWKQPRICRALGVSIRTYYRRLPTKDCRARVESTGS